METGSDNENEIHKLNILISYPVKWTVSAIMRDYVHNFYDAVGYKDFKHQFKYKYESGVLVMMSRSSFDVDWLYYLGTSTKRNSNTATAGMFGEGFKIASLVAYRDYKYDISMESANWRIRVTEAEEMIDHKVVSCLAYEKTERIDDGLTMLCLSNVSYKDYEMLLNVIDDFFYPENPRLEPLIGGRNGYELYRSADTGNGCIFSQYQLRYILRKLPFIVSNAHYRVDRVKLPHNLKVNPVFRLLYASSVVDKYLESMQKFYRSCSDYEERRICILFRAIEILYGIGMFYDERPKIFIFDRDVREVGGYFPQVFWVRDYSCKSVRKYRIEKLILCKDDVVTNDFGGALIKLLDLLANAYSMERSSKRAYMLTNVGKMLIKQRHAITLYIKEWSDVRE